MMILTRFIFGILMVIVFHVCFIFNVLFVSFSR